MILTDKCLGGTDERPTFATIKQAKAAGFHQPKPEEYGGEVLVVKGHRLVRNCEIAKSRSEWSELDYCVPKDAVPHAKVHMYRIGHYDVFRFDQVVPKRKTSIPPAVRHEISCVSLCAAIYSVNQSAKRYRDGASNAYFHSAHGTAGMCREEKEELYRLKDRGIAEAIRRGWLIPDAMHGGLVVYRGGGYCFHSRLVAQGVELNADENSEHFFREARPRESHAMRVMDAKATLGQLPEPEGFDLLPAPSRNLRDRDVGLFDE
jgi:hypothetical protein